MPSIFSRIAAGEIPCYKIAEDNSHLAFLDINPLAKGHTLVIPKKETDNIFDIDDPAFRSLFGFARAIGLAIGAVVPCKRVGITVIGLEVPHAHIHLIPINGITDMEFSQPKLSFTREEFTETAQLIHQAYQLQRPE
jgi:histidine triad (HIT) family protein